MSMRARRLGNTAQTQLLAYRSCNPPTCAKLLVFRLVDDADIVAIPDKDRRGRRNLMDGFEETKFVPWRGLWVYKYAHPDG